MAAHDELESNLLGNRAPRRTTPARRTCTVSAVASLLVVGLVVIVVVLQLGYDPSQGREEDGRRAGWRSSGGEEAVESEVGVVAADDGRCSEVGVRTLREGGHAVDAVVATALCLGVVHQMSSGIGGGAFIVVRSSDSGAAQAFDSRETAPLAASQNMYTKDPSSKCKGALSMGVPGEIAGLHAVWSKYGRLSWKSLFQPSIKLARDGFVVEPYLAHTIESSKEDIMADPGLRRVFAPGGRLLQANDTCYNPELANTLDAIATDGPQAFYNGSIGEKLIKDVRDAGGVATMEDLKSYRIEIMEAMEVDVMGYKILGMPPPSSGTVGMALVLNILGSYIESDAVGDLLGLHRLVEALKHMFAIRMNLGDPDFVNITNSVSDMLSPSFAEKLQKKIFDNTTFGPGYYMPRWSQLRDHGTSHLSIVDADRNAVSMTTTVNYYFGAGVMSSSTGIVLNNEMNDFSTPTEVSPDHLPPAPANFIEPNKRPLSSMMPIIVLKDNQVAGVVGGSGGMHIIPAVTQVFLNHFILGMEPLAAVQHPRVYHELIPNEVRYENWTAIGGEHIELAENAKEFLEQRGHRLRGISGGAVCQLVVHNLQQPVRSINSHNRNWVFHGLLTAVSDPRKDGRPAGI